MPTAAPLFSADAGDDGPRYHSSTSGPVRGRRKKRPPGRNVIDIPEPDAAEKKTVTLDAGERSLASSLSRTPARESDEDAARNSLSRWKTLRVTPPHAE